MVSRQRLLSLLSNSLSAPSRPANSCAETSHRAAFVGMGIQPLKVSAAMRGPSSAASAWPRRAPPAASRRYRWRRALVSCHREAWSFRVEACDSAEASVGSRCCKDRSSARPYRCRRGSATGAQPTVGAARRSTRVSSRRRQTDSSHVRPSAELRARDRASLLHTSGARKAASSTFCRLKCDWSRYGV